MSKQSYDLVDHICYGSNGTSSCITNQIPDNIFSTASAIFKQGEWRWYPWIGSTFINVYSFLKAFVFNGVSLSSL